MVIMVCKGDESMSFGARLYTYKNGFSATRLHINFKKGTGKTDALGRNLKPGECGFLGKSMHARLEPKIVVEKDMSLILEIDNGQITVSSNAKPWSNLRTKNKIVQFTVRIENGVRIVGLN